MAALSVSVCRCHVLHSQRLSRRAAEEFRIRIRSISPIVVCCQNQEPSESRDSSDSSESKSKKSMKKDEKSGGLVVRIEKMGKELKEKLSPKRKGDWKDLTLMSLSFAVYVYISQKIVCAYFAWIMSMPKQL